MLCLVAAQLVWRCYGLLLHPELRAEDGAKVFAYFYAHREPMAMFRLKAGYLPLLPNVLGFLAVRLPARATPYFLTIAPTLLTLATLSVFRASAYRRYVASDALRFSVCLALALAPIGTHFTVCSTDYSIWNALLLLMLLVPQRMPRSAPGAVLFSLVAAGLIWTHPLSLLALPATLLWLWRDKGVFPRVLQGLLVLCQAAHVWLGTEPHHAAAVKGEPAWQRLVELGPRLLHHLGRGIVAPSVFPWGSGEAASDYTIAGLFFVALLLCAVLPKERLATPSLYAWVAYGIVAPMTLIVLVRARDLHAARYYYVSKAFTAIALCLVLWQVLFSATRRWSPRFKFLEAVPPFAMLLYFVFMNEAMGGLQRYRQFDPENGELVAKFFFDLADAERKQGGHCNIYLRCRKRHRDWPFAVDTRSDCVENSGAAQ